MDEPRAAEDQEARERAGLLLDMVTPTAKQWSQGASSLAIEVGGGYGYTLEH